MVVGGGNDGKAGRVAAVAELLTVADEIMNLVRMMDGFNRYRFSRDPARRTAWKSVKHVVTPSRVVDLPDEEPVHEPEPGGTAEGVA
ncbi:MAG: hypothetical protein ABI647_20180 [Gemmatimonadota bacterium]